MAPRDARRHLRRLLGAAFTVGLAVAVFVFVLPAISRYGAVVDEIRSLRPAWLGALAAALLLNVTTSALPWRVVLPELGLVGALRITQASTALITVVPGGAPAGMALTFGMARSRGIGPASAGLAVALTGIWSQLSTFLFPLVALVLLAATGPVTEPVGSIAAAGLVLAVLSGAVLAAALASSTRAHRFGEQARRVAAFLLRLARRGPPSWGGESLVRLRHTTLQAVRERGIALTLATLANQLTGFVVFDLSLRALGITLDQVSLAESFAAWSLARLIESLPLTPGGIGLVELGLVGTLLGFGAPRTPVVAAVLLYRALVVLPTLLLGAAAGLTWRISR